MKKQILLGMSLLGMVALAGCNNQSTGESTTIPQESTSTPIESSQAEGSSSSANGSGSSNEDKIIVEPNSYNKTNTTVYMVGDSTMCIYNTANEYYPKYGYGTQMDKYFDTNYVTFNNLALSGRSSKSFLEEGNYNTLKNSIKSGDYLIIGWGHNDEKYGTATFRNANYDSIDLALADENSFQSCVYNNYVKLALDKGAFPILASPIVRLDKNNDYTKNSGHIYTDSTTGVYCGDYRKAVEDLATKYSIPFVDLTTITKDEYTKLTFDVAKKYHRVSNGTDESEGLEPDWSSGSLDTTHINYYGANFIAYEFAKNLQSTSSNLKYYAKNGTAKPTEAMLEKYSEYTWSNYQSPDLASYNPADAFKTTTSGWYGTAFGNMGGNSTSPFTAKETSTGVYTVGSNNSGKGKFESGSDGFAFLFKQIATNQNFTLTAKITVTSAPTTKQGGFGVMLRDDCYINVTEAKTINSEFAAGGLLVNNNANGGNTIFSRYSNTLSKVSTSEITSLPKANSVYEVSLQKIGQSTIITVDNGTKYTYTFMDYEYSTKDTSYMYVGFFANRGITITIENVVYTDNGTNTGA